MSRLASSHTRVGTAPVPVIDLFAGPGGLGEGFSACYSHDNRALYSLDLSIEKDKNAQRTLLLRAFFRQFEGGAVPDEYYAYLRGEISREDLFSRFPIQSRKASCAAWCAELGSESAPPQVVDLKIRGALRGEKMWVLIGGPPCQAYSTVGRSRLRRADPVAFEKDPRHFLYREYLRILAIHRPPFFVFENVKGILTSKINGENIFSHILADLQAPREVADGQAAPPPSRRSPRYRIFALKEGTGASMVPKDVSRFIIESEKYGIPQTRHRVILLGVRGDIKAVPRPLQEFRTMIGSWDVIRDLPQLRSGLSREMDSADLWGNAVRSIIESQWLNEIGGDERLKEEIISACNRIENSKSTGARFMRSVSRPAFHSSWYVDERLEGICNHSSRFHMRTDLHRYMFSSCFGKIYRRSPLLKDFPAALLPKHSNVVDAIETKTRLFSDRFRVQLPDSPATTITSHLARDGHYFIHPDPAQCRSYTVREAARLQTFPDNYFFEGSKTSQYEQVGNAVPPLLAFSIAELVYDMIEKIEKSNTGCRGKGRHITDDVCSDIRFS